MMTPESAGNREIDHDEMGEVLQELEDDAAKSGLANERIQFFLKHQPLILEWQALADETWAEVKKALADIHVELADGRAAAAGLGLAIRIVGEERQGPVLFRTRWCPEVEGEPHVGFMIGWDSRPDPSGTWPNTTRPYYGVLAGGTSDEGKRQLRLALKPLAAECLRRSDPVLAKFQLGQQWTAYRRMDASAKWYENIAQWRQSIAVDFVKAATVWADVIDKAFGA